MARTASVRVKNGYWYSEAGGVGRYFGSTKTTTKTQAMARMYLALADAGEDDHDIEDAGGNRRGRDFIPVVVQDSPTQAGRKEITPRGRSRKPPTPELIPSFPSPIPGSKTLSLLSPLTVASLTTMFLAWVERHRDTRTLKERERHLSRFRIAYGDLDAIKVQGSHLDAFRDSLRVQGHAPEYVRKHEVSLGACFRWGVKHGHLPAGFSPFATTEPTRVPRRPLLESDLPTEDEVRKILVHAKGVMHDILAVYHATGARTQSL